jgi:hypothetical protein
MHDLPQSGLANLSNDPAGFWELPYLLDGRDEAIRK